MWSRAQLKSKAKYALKNNYWKAVLVAMVVMIVSGGVGSQFEWKLGDRNSNNNYYEQFGYGNEYHYGDHGFYQGELHNPGDFGMEFSPLEDFMRSLPVTGGLIGIVLIAILVFGVIAVTATVFVLEPLEVGTSRFFFKNLNEKAEVKEVAFGYDNSWGNIVKIMFFRSLYTILWTLLFIIPGIVKGYEYKMIPYLLAENPNLTKEQAFALSKQMMTGQKWSAFVLDLSFIGWSILSIFTFGILSVFYVSPYRQHTYAALYEELSLMNGRPAFSQSGTQYQYQYQNQYQSNGDDTTQN